MSSKHPELLSSGYRHKTARKKEKKDLTTKKLCFNSTPSNEGRKIALKELQTKR